jgi:hypothetical protein
MEGTDMAIELAKSVRVVFLLLVAMGSGWTQQRPAAAKHASDIRAEQTRQVIAASPACQKAIADPKTETEHTYRVPAAAFLPNLESLMEKSDEVVLSGIPMDGFSAVSPSGEDAVEYVDVKVLQSWKGPHHPGDTVTFEIPSAMISCSLSRNTGGPLFVTETGPGLWLGIQGFGPMVLFLRHARGSETQMTPGLRLTEAGVQGVFETNFPVPPGNHGHFPPEESGCRNNISAGKYPENPAECLAYLRSSDVPIRIPYREDPLVKGYGGMAIADFLNKVQEVADSLGYEPPE